MKLCPSCKSVQRDKAEVCSVCGVSFSGGGEAQVDQPTPASQSDSTPQAQVPQETPPVQQETPPAQQQTPAVEQQTPAIGQETPPGQQQTPSVGQETPPGQQQTPSIGQETPPVQQPATQVQQDPRPADQAGTPDPADIDKEISSIYEAEVSKDSVYSADTDTIYDDGVYEMNEDIDSQVEILEQIEDLRKDGYNVSRLEKALDLEPQKIWDTLAEFMNDVEELQLFKTKMAGLDVTGLEGDAKIINDMLDNPDKVEEVRVLINFLVTKISSRPEGGQEASPGSQQTPAAQDAPPADAGAAPQQDTAAAQPTDAAAPAVQDSPEALTTAKTKGVSLLDVIKKLTLARNSYSEKNYDKARALYAEIMEMDPTNDEAKFYLEKIDNEMASMTPEEKEAVAAPIKVMMPKKILAPKVVTPADAGAEAKEEPKKEGPAGIPAAAEKGTSQDVLDSMKSDPMLKEDILDDLAGIKKDDKPKAAEIEKPAPVEKKEAKPALSEEEKKVELARLDARAFKASINKNYKDALAYYDQMMELDPEFKDLKKKRAECLEKMSGGGEKAPAKVKKKKKKKVKKK